MNGRANDKIKEVECYLVELEEFCPASFEEYLNDTKAKAACERYAEKIIEAVVDLAFLLIKNKGFNLPEEDKQAFDILANEKVISDELAKRLKDAKGMRNILAHEYGEVNDEIVFNSISEELVKDAREFIKEVKKRLR